MLIIGMTGTIGSGKTTAAQMFKELGAKVLNADKIGHAVIRSGQPCFSKVLRRFGKKILSGKEIDRKKLAKVVFGNHRALKDLERITHPVILREMKRRTQALASKKKQIVVWDAALLIESGFYRWVDYCVVVKSSRQVTLNRLKKKGITGEAAWPRMQAQMPLGEKMKHADIIINNNGSLKQTRAQVQQVWQTLRRVLC